MKSLFQKNYDFVYFHYLTYSTLCLLPFLFLSKPKYIINIHGDDLVGCSWVHKVMGTFSGVILKHCVAVVVPSEHFKQELIKRFSWFKEHKVIVSPSGGINSEIFYPMHNNELAGYSLGYISRIDEGKGWPELLQAIAKLKTLAPALYDRISLDMYGTGSQVEQMKQLIGELQLEGTIIYHGAVSQPELGEKYRQMTCFVFPTHRESFGLVAVEAMSCGLPILASNVAPVNDIVQNGRNGLLFNVKDADSLAKAIIEFFDLELAERLDLSREAYSSTREFQAPLVAEQLKHDLVKVIKN
ncbi:hypothetical protein PCIT_a1659 [Pseudoalteromonas citrea]|uniref:Glycosyl transferase family 1 domain-containing protein n=2 Tax=Pseudoalteromonas citrea TaxID=43655 RepID=A0AAD4AMM5_9GAMM|nr:hypothetical protein PCIT_a1659 [Pseudoalteromonas citrea]